MKKICYVALCAILFSSFSCTRAVKPRDPSRVCCPNEAFCGESSHGNCRDDSDCTKGGCSGQICQSVMEGLITTTCEWRECYNPAPYCFECACLSNKCQWIKK